VGDGFAYSKGFRRITPNIYQAKWAACLEVILIDATWEVHVGFELEDKACENNIHLGTKNKSKVSKIKPNWILLS